jgi:hypothetical protein
MAQRQSYVKREAQTVAAVQLDLDTKGFTYQKWGGTQTCKPGDWIVSNAGDTYTVDRESFARTYRSTGHAEYVKVAPVYAEVATTAGDVKTKEGTTHYDAGDYLVYNEADGGDPYAVSKENFERMYEKRP